MWFLADGGHVGDAEPPVGEAPVPGTTAPGPEVAAPVPEVAALEGEGEGPATPGESCYVAVGFCEASFGELVGPGEV